MTTKLCGMNSFHSNIKRRKERKKQEVTSEMADIKVQNERERVSRVECRRYKKRKHGLGGAICRSRVSSLAGRVL